MRDDNRLRNLELWSTSQPSGQRVVDKIEFCIEFLHRHGYQVSESALGELAPLDPVDEGRDLLG